MGGDWLRRLVEPSAEITDVAERRRARALATIVLVVVPFGLVTVVAQLAVRPGFFPTFVSNTLALVLLGVFGVLARTRHYRLAAGAATLVIVATCAAAGLNDPDDPVWWAYSMLGVLLATVLISIRGAALVAATAAATTLLVEVANGFDVVRAVAPLMFHVVVSPVLLALAHHRDLIEHDRQAELALQGELLVEAQRAANLIHWRLRREDDALEVSPELGRLLGVPQGRASLDVLVSRVVSAEQQEELRAALSGVGDEPVSVEVELARADGARRFVVVTAQPYGGRDERLLIGTLQDVTERVLAEQEKRMLQEHLNEALRMETVGRIAGGIAHDFNNLLTVITASAQLVRGATGREHAELVDDIESAAERGSRLTKQLLAYARKQVLAPTQLDLVEVVGALQPILQRLAKDRTLHLELATDAAPLIADRSQLEQVLVNLVVNATAATHAGGRIDIGVYTRESGPSGGPLHGRSAVVLTVGDDGEGMSAETRARAFEPFFTTRSDRGGTGLGLSTVHGVVHQSGGHVELASAPDEGTTFTIYFPKSLPAANAASERAGISVADGGLEVLLVDDDPQVLRSISRMLEAMGFSVLAAQGPIAARRLWREAKDHIDVVISDVMMPGTNGPELVAELRREKPELAFVLMSGLSADTFDKHGLNGPGGVLLTKPFSQAELSARLLAALDASASREAAAA